ncbi:MAG: hypothetical protein PGN08_09940, partial [Sphingomonas taxi]
RFSRCYCRRWRPAQTPRTAPHSGERAVRHQPCVRPELQQAAGTPKGGVRKLGEMPPAKPIYTVLREIDGCPTPVAVRPG